MLNIDFINNNLPVNGIVKRVYYFKETPSTNDTAKSIAETDILVITDNQSSGKGRQGRKWISEQGKNLTFSIKKKLDLKPGENPNIIFYFSYYLHSFLESVLKKAQPSGNIKELQIKWPNDILYNGSKICGILTESVFNSNEYIIGIGLNVNQRTFPGGLDGTSLVNITGAEFELERLLVSLLVTFSGDFEVFKYKNFEGLYNSWKNSSNITGRQCIYSINNGNVKRGIISNLCNDGSIEILSENEIFKYYSGEIKLTGIST